MKQIMIVYHSQEKGNTRKMADLVAEGCRKVQGVQVQMVNVNQVRLEASAVEKADGLAIGSPDYFSYVAGCLKQFFDDLKLAEWAGRKVTGKPYVAFITHGGGGKAVESIEKLASACKLVKAADSAVCRNYPQDPADVAKAVALGEALARRVVETP